MKEVKGPLAEGLKWLGDKIRSLSGESGTSAILLGLADITAIRGETLADWFNTIYTPKGENLIKLFFLLETCGFSPVEIEKVKIEFKDLYKIIALDMYTIDSLSEKLSVSRDTVLRWAFGKIVPITDRRTGVLSLIQESHNELETLRAAYDEKLVSLGLKERKTGDTHPSIIPKDEHPASIEKLGRMIKEMLPLAKQVSSDQFTAEDRKLLRDLTREGHSNGVFELSNVLNLLCGERAHKEIGKKTS